MQNLATKFLLELITSCQAVLPYPGHLCSFELILRFYCFSVEALKGLPPSYIEDLGMLSLDP